MSTATTDFANVTLVMAQTGATKEETLQALQNNNDDIVEAIFSLGIRNDNDNESVDSNATTATNNDAISTTTNEAVGYVMAQTGVTKAEAVKTLRSNNDDIISAIIQVTKSKQ